MWLRWDDLSFPGRGVKADYRLDGDEIGRGGQARVLRGVHRGTGSPIAFKRLLPALDAQDDARARFRREIEVGTHLRHEHVVPVLDADPDGRWFVMPLADATLESRRVMLVDDPDGLRLLISQVAEGLGAAHARQWIHRDVTPANLLGYESEEGTRWAVADWGLGRRPAGTTTLPGRTRVGVAYGTEGFAAPELSADAHLATAASDVFSLGQVIGWLLTGQRPQPNVPLLPPAEPWRHIVAAATRRNVGERPQSMATFLALVESELAALPEGRTQTARRLLDEARNGSVQSGIRLLDIAEASPDDFELYAESVSLLASDTILFAAEQRSSVLVAVLDSLVSLRAGNFYARFHQVENLEDFAARAFTVAVSRNDIDLAVSALEAFCVWDNEWDQWRPQRVLRRALTGVRKPLVERVARVLRRYPSTVAHLSELADDSRVDPGIRAVINGGRN